MYNKKKEQQDIIIITLYVIKNNAYNIIRPIEKTSTIFKR